jgi:integrase/recombinase XerD
MTYDLSLTTYLQQLYTPKTVKAYRREIEAYQKNYPQSDEALYKDIVEYLGVLRKRYSNPRTLNRILCSIKAYYDFLNHTGKRKDNPAKSIRLRDKQSRDIQLQDLFTTNELEALLTAKKERYPKLEYRNKALMSLLIYQALKPSEIERLETTEINLEAATIYIKSSAKNNSRTLALKANQILLFKKYLEEIRPSLIQEKESNAFIIGQRKEPMTAEDITKHIKRNYNPDSYQDKPRNVNALTIRQSVITNLLKSGHDLRVVQVFAGHKYPSTTEKYKQTNIEALQTALQIYHPIK